MMKCKTVKVDKLPTIRRLPIYLDLLRGLSREGCEYVASGHLADRMGIESILVRKDLELTGINGTRSVGYYIPDLARSIEEFLGWGDTKDAFLVGVGQLGSALLGFKELMDCGLKIVAAFDNDPDKINKTVQGVPVFSVVKLPELLKRLNVRLAVLTLPSEEAQGVADLLVKSDIQGIWNFTSAALNVPDSVTTHKEDFISGYAVLSVKMARNTVNE